MASNSYTSQDEHLVFLKLGGSLITDKHQARTPRLDVISRLADEIASSRQSDPHMKLLLGNGAGSFGHIPASRYGTREGVSSRAEWLGFALVWHDAATLNRLFIDALRSAGLPAISLPPSASITTLDGQIVNWNTYPVESALSTGLLPVIYGDVIFDQERGGTILSTEDLFVYLAHLLKPQRILLAGIEDGVWEDYPSCTKLIQEITPATLPFSMSGLRGSGAVDVTGGMASKVLQNIDLVASLPGLEVQIFSGLQPGSVAKALSGEKTGTLIYNPVSDDRVSQI